MTISPSKLDFGLQRVNSQSAATPITIYNVSTSPVHFNQITTSGIDFRGTNNCGAELAIDAECTIQVAFRPAIIGDRMGAIIIAASDPGSPHYVPLAGTGE